MLQISSRPMETKPRNINSRTQSWLQWDKSSFELQFINYKMLWTIFTTGSWHQGLDVRTKYTKLNCSTKLWQREAAPAYSNMYVKIALVILSITSSYITSLICQNVLRPRTHCYWALMFIARSYQLEYRTFPHGQVFLDGNMNLAFKDIFNFFWKKS